MSFTKYDFQGWATKNDIRCSDGKTIRRNAFINDDGKVVPLVWNHDHSSPESVLGHALLENRDDGVWFYAKLNDTPKGQVTKQLIDSGDIKNVSIYANQVRSEAGNVVHGCIRELSVVLAGANPQATIEYPIVVHSDGNSEEVYDEVIIHSAEKIDNTSGELKEEKMDEKETKNEGKTVKDVLDSLTDEQRDVVYFLIGKAAEDAKNGKGAKKVEADDDDDDDDGKEVKHSAGDKTVKEIFDELNDEQKQAVYFLIGKAVEDAKSEVKHSFEYEGGDDYMKYNVFDETTNDVNEADVLMQSAMPEIFEDAKKGKNSGLLSDNFIAHADQFGIEGIEWLFPNDKELNTPPTFLKNDPTDWVKVIMNGVHRSPFSRVRSTFADLTEDEARAKGYIKGKMKKEQVFSLLRRSTSPQTVYKKQKLHRDDVIDITDFDVVAWIKGEMRTMLEEELARAILMGDGRSSADEDKIQEDHIRPIANDADLFTIKAAVTAGEDLPKNFIKASLKARSKYRGKGSPILFTTAEMLTDMLLIEDELGRSIYDSESALATKMRVSKIVEVPVMENTTVGGKKLLGVIVNPADYNVGADKGGAVNMFEDFDIDFNLQKYLIETRISGALTTPYSAIALYETAVPASVDGGLSYSKAVAGGEEDEQVNP